MKKMRTMIPLLLAAMILVTGLPVTAEEDESAPPQDKGTFILDELYQSSSYDGSRHRVAEHTDVEPNLLTRLSYFSSPYSKYLIDIQAERLSHFQQSASATFDVNRVLQVDAEFDSLIHRLDHDPLENLQAVSDVKVVRSTDFEPGAEYQIRHQVFDTDLTIRPPGAGWLTFSMGIREQHRDGMKQVLTTSHCTSCHTTAQGREINQSTRDLSVGAHARFGMVDLDYEVMGRRFEEAGATPTAPYERAYHPGNPSGSLALPFEDRLWFQNGSFATDRTPETEKLTHKFKASVTGKKAHAFQVTAITSTNENRDTNLEYTFTGYRGRYRWKPRKNLRLVFYGRRNVIENDSVLVDLAALNNVVSAPTSTYPVFGGPITFQDWRRQVEANPALNFERFMRESAYDRTEDTLGADLFFRPLRKASLRVGYSYNLVDRDNVILADGTGETTTHKIKLSWNQRFGRRLRWNNTFHYLMRDNPYMNVNGAGRALLADPNGLPVDLANGSPKSPLSLQYYQLHQLRIADVSNIPSEEMRIRSQATWAPSPTLALSGNIRYRGSENDELDTSQWERETAGIGATLWVVPAPDFSLTFGGDYHQEETDTRFHVPLMDG